jgi:hypothetical protein
MNDLANLQSKWLDLYWALRADSQIGKRFTPPFVSVAPRHYDPHAVPSLLYVGKAENASGEPSIFPYRDAFEVDPTLEYCRKGTVDFLEEIRAGKYDSAFWRFARQLGQAAAGEAEIDDLQNVVWTNICKLTDVYCGNPLPAILWTRHHEQARREYLDACADVVNRLARRAS